MKTENERLVRIGCNAKPPSRKDAKTVLAMSQSVVLLLLNGTDRVISFDVLLAGISHSFSAPLRLGVSALKNEQLDPSSLCWPPRARPDIDVDTFAGLGGTHIT